MIVKATEKQTNENLNLVMLISGAPGVGKTTLCCSAEKPIVLDVDRGMKRVNIKHRADSSTSKTYEEILADVEEAYASGYQTLVIDTVGALLDSIIAHIIAENPKNAQADGTLTLKAYGILKNIFLQFSANVRAKFKNTIFVFHEVASRDGDNTFYDIVAAGSAKVLVWQPIDIGARLFIQGGKRYLGFTPTEQYNAKSSFGIKGLIEIPELEDGKANDFLTKLFAKVRENLAKEAETFSGEEEKYKLIMQEGKDLISKAQEPKDFKVLADYIKELDHALTSEQELKAELANKIKSLGYKWDKNAKEYILAESK